MQALQGAFGLPFAEQIDFFRRKINLPSERWDDIRKAAHDRGFIVAGAMKADLVADLRAAVQKAIEQGTSLETFRKDFKEAVRKHGWTGWTGEGTKAGEAWRTRVIYETNLRTSYAAGRWAQLKDPDLLKLRPFWRYVHADSVLHPRPHHKAWGDARLTLPHDHPFWRTHYPPNGWGCRCRVVAVKGPAAGDEAAPPEGWDTADPKTGAPPGIDQGWGYAPGANTDTALRQMVQDKLIDYPPAITKALSHDVGRFVQASVHPEEFVREVLADAGRTEPLWLGFVENFEEVGAAAGADVKGYMVLLPAQAPRHVEKAHAWDGHGQRAARPQDYRHLVEVLGNPDKLERGHDSQDGLVRVVATKAVGGEVLRSVWEVRPGRRNRALVLMSLVVKTA